MSMVRVAVFAVIAVAVGGAAYVYRGEVAQRLGLGASASAAEKGSASPAAMAQPQGRRGRANPAGAVPVVVTSVEPKAMPIVIEAVGTVQSISSVQLKSRLDSQIMKVNVEEGALVKEGDLLFELDARTLKAQLSQIEAQIRKDQAQLEQAKRDTVRAGDLLTKGAGTVVARDTNFTTQKAAEAQLEADEAMRQNIQTQISYSEIRAPVSGRIGSIPYKAGTTLRVGDNTATAVLATINQVDPIYVSFAMPQVFLTDLRAAMAKGGVKVNAVIDDDHKQSGVIAFIENTVDRQHRHRDGQGAHRQRQRGPVARPVREGRGRARHRARGAFGPGGRGPARNAGPLRLRHQGRQHGRSPPDHHQAHAVRRVGDRQRAQGRRIGRDRRPAAPGQRRFRRRSPTRGRQAGACSKRAAQARAAPRLTRNRGSRPCPRSASAAR